MPSFRGSFQPRDEPRSPTLQADFFKLSEPPGKPQNTGVGSLSPGFPGGSDGKESTCMAGDLASIPWLGRSPEEGRGNSFQHSGLENPHG